MMGLAGFDESAGKLLPFASALVLHLKRMAVLVSVSSAGIPILRANGFHFDADPAKQYFLTSGRQRDNRVVCLIDTFRPDLPFSHARISRVPPSKLRFRSLRRSVSARRISWDVVRVHEFYSGGLTRRSGELRLMERSRCSRTRVLRDPPRLPAAIGRTLVDRLVFGW